MMSIVMMIYESITTDHGVSYLCEPPKSFEYVVPVRRSNIAARSEANVPTGSLWWIWMLFSDCRYLLARMYVASRSSIFGVRLIRPGGLLYALCTSWPLFGFEETVEGGELDPLPEGYTPQLRALIERCMAVDPRARPNALEVLCEAMSL